MSLDRRIVTLANRHHSSEPHAIERHFRRLRDAGTPTLDLETLARSEDCFDNTLNQLRPGDTLVAIGGDNTANRAIHAAKEYGDDVVVAAVAAGGACDTAHAWNGKLATDIIGVINSSEERTVYPVDVYTNDSDRSHLFFSSLSLGWTAIAALGIIDEVREIRRRRKVSREELATRAVRAYVHLQQEGENLPPVTTLWDELLPHDARVARESRYDGLTDIFVANSDIIGGSWQLSGTPPYLDPEKLHIYLGNLRDTRMAAEFSLRAVYDSIPGRRVERITLDFDTAVQGIQSDGDFIPPTTHLELVKSSPVTAIHPRKIDQR